MTPFKQFFRDLISGCRQFANDAELATASLVGSMQAANDAVANSGHAKSFNLGRLCPSWQQFKVRLFSRESIKN
jgi:hypothetical protein